MEFPLSTSKPKRCCSESATLNMPANLKNLAVARGMENVSFHSNPKERQCQRMLKLLHKCTLLTHKKGNAQNSPSHASVILQLWTFWCSSWFPRRHRNQRSSYQDLQDHQNTKNKQKKPSKFQKIIYFCFIDYAKAFDCVDYNKLWTILKEMELPDHLTCLLRNLNAHQEASRTGNGTATGSK